MYDCWTCIYYLQNAADRLHGLRSGRWGRARQQKWITDSKLEPPQEHGSDFSNNINISLFFQCVHVVPSFYTCNVLFKVIVWTLSPMHHSNALVLFQGPFRFSLQCVTMHYPNALASSSSVVFRFPCFRWLSLLIKQRHAPWNLANTSITLAMDHQAVEHSDRLCLWYHVFRVHSREKKKCQGQHEDKYTWVGLFAVHNPAIPLWTDTSTLLVENGELVEKEEMPKMGTDETNNELNRLKQ